MINEEKYANAGINTRSRLFKIMYNAGLLDEVDTEFATNAKSYWKSNYNAKIDPVLHMAFMNLTGKKETRLIPGRILQREIFPVFNDYNVSAYYGDKNIYGKIIKPPYGPKTIIRKIGGNFFDPEYNYITVDQAKEELLKLNMYLIIKLTKANNGHGVTKFKVENNVIFFEEDQISFDELMEKYNQDFIIQEVIEQHPNMAAPHPSSVNTVRILTFRWKGEIKYLFAFARFGINNDTRDNSTVDISPALGITDTGEFYKVALNKNGERFTHHPTTNFCFADLDPIPDFENFKQHVIDYHKEFIHIDIIAWDIALGKDGNPIILECNFAGSTSFYQLVTERSFFGDLTEEVLQHVTNEWKARKPALMRKHRKKSIENKRLKRNIKTLEKKLKKANEGK